jgi:hypothetical protein
MAKYLTDWRQPDEYCGFPSTPFTATSVFRGEWQGVLEDGGANMPVQLTIDSSEHTTLTIGSNRAEAVTAMLAEGSAFTGASTGQINSPDAIRTGAAKLQIKLLPYDNRLVGRVFAIAGDPHFKNVRLPYVLTLSRNLAAYHSS